MNSQSIQEHYDLLSPYYESLWDRHIHHGFFERGEESRAEATDKLIRLLLQHAELPSACRVLDIGCGLGATATLFAEEFGWDVLGLSISPEQIRMARDASAHLPSPPQFEVQDVNDLRVDGPFDLIWSVEMISHLHNRSVFFKRVRNALAARGQWCIAAWLKQDDLTTDLEKRYIRPIENGMMVDLPTASDYFQRFRANDLRLAYFRDISRQVAKTWDISLHVIGRPDLLRLARDHGPEVVAFLKSFRAMQRGFQSGCFRYALMVAARE